MRGSCLILNSTPSRSDSFASASSWTHRVGVLAHGAQLVDGEQPAVPPDPRLAEDRRAGGVATDEERKDHRAAARGGPGGRPPPTRSATSLRHVPGPGEAAGRTRSSCGTTQGREPEPARRDVAQARADEQLGAVVLEPAAPAAQLGVTDARARARRPRRARVWARTTSSRSSVPARSVSSARCRRCVGRLDRVLVGHADRDGQERRDRPRPAARRASCRRWPERPGVARPAPRGGRGPGRQLAATRRRHDRERRRQRHDQQHGPSGIGRRGAEQAGETATADHATSAASAAARSSARGRTAPREPVGGACSRRTERPARARPRSARTELDRGPRRQHAHRPRVASGRHVRRRRAGSSGRSGGVARPGTPACPGGDLDGLGDAQRQPCGSPVVVVIRPPSRRSRALNLGSAGPRSMPHIGHVRRVVRPARLGGRQPTWWASPTAASWEVTSSLARIDLTWVRTVASDTTPTEAISRTRPAQHQVRQDLALADGEQVQAGLQLDEVRALARPRPRAAPRAPRAIITWSPWLMRRTVARMSLSGRDFASTLRAPTPDRLAPPSPVDRRR